MTEVVLIVFMTWDQLQELGPLPLRPWMAHHHPKPPPPGREAEVIDLNRWPEGTGPEEEGKG